METFITGLHCGKRVKELPKFSAEEELFGQCPKERLFFLLPLATFAQIKRKG